MIFFFAGVAQLVEHQPSKLRVAGSNLVARSEYFAPHLRRRNSGATPSTFSLLA
jgi:hypothetical protein